MIIQKKGYTLNDIVTFKQTNGEEMIAKFIEETDKEFVINRPMTLVPTQNGGLAMRQTVFSADLNTHNVSLQKTSVSLTGLTRSEIKSEYIKGTTGITPASSLAGLSNAKGST